MKILFSFVFTLPIWISLSLPVWAHHSFGTFYEVDRTVEIEGVVTSFKLVSPHSEMMLEVTSPEGQKVTWRITARTGAANAKRAGWKPEDFIGQQVKVEGNPARNPDATAMAAGVVTFPDGRVICLGGCPGVPTQ